jgi:thioredoxin-related protein
MQTKFLIIILMFFNFSSLAEQGQFLGAKTIEEHPSWFKSSFLDLAEDSAESADANKHLILYVYQDGCPYCAKLIEDNFHNPSLVKTIRENFDVVAINMWGDREIYDFDEITLTEKQFAEKLHVQFTPTLIFFDNQNNIILRLNGYQNSDKMQKALDFTLNKHYKNKSFAEFTATNDNGKLNSQEFFSKNYDLTKQQDKYLAVLFERPNCAECDDLHTRLLSQDNIKNLITQMQVVQLNTNTDKLITSNGKKISAKNWYQDLSLTYFPAMVIFDKNGKEIIRGDGYFRNFHFESILDYALTESYKTQPNFQRYIEHKADKIRETGRDVDIWRD